MTDNQRATQFAKLEITGTLEVLTGLHIGTGGGFSAIGATDKPVVRDPLTKLPLIPGTSLKGKVRTLLSRQYAADEGSFADKPAADHPTIRRLFGDTEEFMTGRLIFRDTRLANKDELVAKGAKTLTEIKFENTINRITAIANPRQMERVIPGSRFDFSLIYEVSFGAKRQGTEPTLPSYEEIGEDFETVVRGLRLLELDYLGGSGTRGYGRVKFHDLSATVPVGKLGDTLLGSLNDKLATF
ncbi:type III-A CRISPR-associated RAMP protein Csm3 [Gordonia sp. (in: high G+C Gram-positive bacteria)]|jgi:CRISPR-associated protein Csm3|uniref:type III-A CRISPR-associated RAMP protein Csm3 n=1 Tax=Gordonia sp. (in: high G+C Gram-positive bacteria) TaxID=84139 RepID=UPI001D75F01A|nr:type III-A CRISPR-associated RAMP protein Csm3 [Gordonia sp. (in: high G+C Gram-positive bacteria)]MCB1293431.1 type III-A CRISPR-associated RAMP protein Csm3 [Gordonia sp. (in: high G+C Gram-positive bacteria)]HMS74763.1 type III-A CRISPR-associated RAMP protein Csm3 [Gordonia sp. (in: high G+C Gram-positive bacteria)]HQV17151.1 type III-A CRISPR-associated RAMP protein Csm3 [Gordonia sp. (in: high G+C Gram-positive bacteria)]